MRSDVEELVEEVLVVVLDEVTLAEEVSESVSMIPSGGGHRKRHPGLISFLYLVVVQRPLNHSRKTAALIPGVSFLSCSMAMASLAEVSWAGGKSNFFWILLARNGIRLS